MPWHTIQNILYALFISSQLQWVKTCRSLCALCCLASTSWSTLKFGMYDKSNQILSKVTLITVFVVVLKNITLIWEKIWELSKSSSTIRLSHLQVTGPSCIKWLFTVCHINLFLVLMLPVMKISTIMTFKEYTYNLFILMGIYTYISKNKEI